jgi:hypothetical protein
MIKNNNIEQLQSFDEKSVVEVQQNPQKKYSLISGIIGGTICIILTIIYVLPDSRMSAWWLIAPVGYLVIASSAKLFIMVFLSPQRMVIHQDSVSIDMVFREKQIMTIIEIDRLEYKEFLSTFVVSASGWMICDNRKLKYFIAKPFYHNFDRFVEAIRKKNPNCHIDNRLLDWGGPKPLAW